jgi:NADH-quinone oxidoreductase subunit G
MCLVDVEKAPKPLPACATPVAEGMKVFTRSERAISAQKATMEFLLINHPLDCPICDQGGECELQDLAMGYGRGVSRYTERKRVVKDKTLGALVSTDMTRCIHCTRCVRFGDEIAGIPTLGAVGRGERMEISTYVEQSLDHEMSGNIIDLCPVGALNNKPFRFHARAWEMLAKPLVSPHDCAGSNLYAHVLRGTVRRVVPRDNDGINETWLSDRDRFSCHGIDAPDRLESPMIKQDGQWQAVSWETALEAARDALHESTKDEGSALGILSSPSATLEEQYLLRRIADRLGSRNIDFRLRRNDFADQAADPAWPSLGCGIAEIESLDGMLLIGCDIRHEVPIVAHRIRKAVTQHNAAFAAVNPTRYEYFFPVAGYVSAPLESLASALAGVVAAAAQMSGGSVSDDVARVLTGVSIDDDHREAAAALVGKERALVLLGHIAGRHPAFSTLRVLAGALCELTGARLGQISEGSNASGAALAGALPHRDPGGVESTANGLDARAMLSSPRRGYLLFDVEPDRDTADAQLAQQALKSADKVVAFASFAGEGLLACADILLPIATFAETPGTYINAEGLWQSFDAAASTPGESRPGWRVLRVLGNLLGVEQCEYRSCADISAELRALLGHPAIHHGYSGEFKPNIQPVEVDEQAITVGIYAIDALVRRSEPLQLTALGRAGQADESAPQEHAQA